MDSAVSAVQEFYWTLTIGDPSESGLYAPFDEGFVFTGTSDGAQEKVRRDLRSHGGHDSRLADRVITIILQRENSLHDAEEVQPLFEMRTHLGFPDTHQPGEFSYERIDFRVVRRTMQYACTDFTREHVPCPPEVIELFREQIGADPRQMNLE